MAVYEAIKSPVDSAKYPNISRWQEHIKSFEAEHASLKGDKSKAAELLNFSAAQGGDDEDIDLFGDEDEVDPEAERIKAERVKEYEARKAAKGPRPPAKSVVTFDVKPWDDETDMVALEK